MTCARHRLFDAKRRDGLTTRMDGNEMRREYRGFINYSRHEADPGLLAWDDTDGNKEVVTCERTEPPTLAR